VDLAAPLRAVDRVQRPRPWLSVPLAVIKRFGDCGAGSLAATIAYYGFFSLFPLLLVLTSVTGIALQDRPDLQARVLDSALTQFPVVGAQIRENVRSIEGSGLSVVLGLALALWAGLGGVRAAQVAMNTVWDVPRKRRPGTPASIGLGLLMLVMLGGFVLIAAVVAGLASSAGGLAGGAIGIVASLVLNVATFALAYRLLTRADVTWRQVLPGAIAAGIGWTALLALGGWLISDRIASSSQVYGTFAIVIGLLGWIYLGAQLALFGAILNVVLADELWPRSLQGELTTADRRALRRSAGQEERIHEQSVDVSFERVPREEGRSMRCGHEGCMCDVAMDQAYCSDHCRDHAASGGHDGHVCECGHAACQAVGE
jgi:YihY family inner membrane protein